MNKKIILFLILLLLFSMLLINYSYLQEKENERTKLLAFVSGNKYLSGMSEGQQLGYVIGLFDMYSYFKYYYFSENYLDCIEKFEPMLVGQIKVFFDKYLEEHPEVWHFAAAEIFYKAIDDSLNN